MVVLGFNQFRRKDTKKIRIMQIFDKIFVYSIFLLYLCRIFGKRLIRKLIMGIRNRYK